MTGKYVLLLRGINVNPSTRVAMEVLRDTVGELGYAGVRTILQSGNVLLDSAQRPDAAGLEAAILSATGVRSGVVVLSLDEFRAIADANPLLEVANDLSRLVITFLRDEVVPEEISRPTDAELGDERLVITPRAVYQWCPNGVLQSQLKPAWWRQLGPLVTARNMRTVHRILAAAS
jgi:uncharacterized protein (DUF1697 family)